jgi:hypothetical protein
MIAEFSGCDDRRYRPGNDARTKNASQGYFAF